MTYASTSASFSGRTGAAAVDKHRPASREVKYESRFNFRRKGEQQECAGLRP